MAVVIDARFSPNKYDRRDYIFGPNYIDPIMQFVLLTAENRNKYWAHAPRTRKRKRNGRAAVFLDKTSVYFNMAAKKLD